jgi:hypothetical protein
MEKIGKIGMLIKNLTYIPTLLYMECEGIGMKKFVKTTVGVKIKGRLIELTTFIDDMEDTTKSVNFKINKGVYKKFEHIVGKGNVSNVIRKFMLAVVKKYERLSDLSNFVLGGYKHGKQKEKG